MHKTAAEMIIIVADPDLEIIVGNSDLSGHHYHIDVDDNQGLQK